MFHSILSKRALAVSAALTLFGASGAFAASLPANFSEQTFSGITNPTALAIAPDGRVFVSQQCGAIRIIKNGAVLSTPFASISVSCSDERGLHSIAFDPNFSSNGYVYVRYTRASPLNNVIGRLQASPPSSDTGGGLTVLFTVPFNGSGQRYHHGGGLVVGNDGMLYSSFGDHLSGSGQNLNNLWGKVVRINIPNGGIPTSNPFYNTTTGDNRAIYAYGLRNPFTMAIQPGTGRIHVNDVGDGASSCCEEVNNLTSGQNFGWPPASNATGRFFGYTATSQGGNAIVGGSFYNPTTQMFPASYVGKYFFGDYGGGWIRYINGSGSAGSLTGFASGIDGPTDVEAANDGSLWYTARNSSNVRRITYAGAVPTATPTATPMAATPTPTPTPIGPTPTPTATTTPNAPPAGSITAPPVGTLYAGGDAVGFSGTCTDPNGSVPASGYFWDIVFHHNTHTHPGVQFTGVTSGSFDLPADGEWDPDQWWRVNLRCTDPQGASSTVFRDVLPRKRTLTLNSSPSGLQVAADGVTGPAPQTMDAVAGMKRILDTNAPQTMGGTTYYFEKWSDGGAKRHDVFMPDANASFTATFKAASAYSEITPAASAVTTSTSDTNVGANTVDNNLATRWSGNGDGAWVKFDLGSPRTVGHVGVAVYQGNMRRNRFDIQVSSDNSNWTTVFSGESSGTTTNEQAYDFPDAAARWVRYLGHGNIGSTNPTMNSVTEVSIFGAALAPNTVSIVGMSFVPANLTIDVGQTVTWVNTDSQAHTATSDTAVWDSGTIAPGGNFAFTFTSPGTYPYTCLFHTIMTGTITVNGTVPTPTPTPTPMTPTPTPTPTTMLPTPTPTPTLPVGDVEITPAAGAVTANTNDGNLPANTVDKNLATRWSGNGDGAWIQYDLGVAKTVSFVKIAVYNGNSRNNLFDLQYSNTGTTWTNILTGAQSGGMTTALETFDFADVSARYIRYMGHMSNVGTFNSLTEVEIWQSGGPTATPTPTPMVTVSPTPTLTPIPPTPTPTSTPLPSSEIAPAAITASTNDGNVPANANDNNLATRWSGNGDGAWLQYDLGATYTVTHVSIAVYNGNSRHNMFDIQVSSSASGPWTNVLTGAQSSGNTTMEETHDVTDASTRYVRYLGHMSDVGTFNSVTEFSVFGAACTSCPTPPPTPTPTPTVPSAGKIKHAGARSSGYGISPFPSAQGWTNAITTMAGYFPGSTPTGVWLVGEIFFAGQNSGQGLEFPNPGGTWDSRIQFQSTDKHEPILDYFDTHGVKVFLQFEPGFAPIDQLIQVTYNRYGHHPSVIGFGVDVEWYHSSSDGGGNAPAGDSVVTAWNNKVKSVNPSYRLFVKHFDRANLPQTLRGDIIFIDDSEQNGSYSGFLSEMKGFADFYDPAYVGYQFGYPSDKGWWSGLATPIPQTIGRALLNQTRQNECGMFWVDFSLRDVLPTN